MIGLPGESLSDFSETVNINRICQPDWLSTSIFFPYPGTDLYSSCKNRGFLKEPLDIEMERAKAVLDFPEFPRKQIQKKYIWFEYWVYKGNRPKYKLLARVFLRKIKSKDRLNYFYRKLSRLRVLRKIRHFFRTDIIKG
jgi:radical SAM superfamily enzyme YgiQ (UPF0313 family)